MKNLKKEILKVNTYDKDGRPKDVDVVSPEDNEDTLFNFSTRGYTVRSSIPVFYCFEPGKALNILQNVKDRRADKGTTGYTEEEQDILRQTKDVADVLKTVSFKKEDYTKIEEFTKDTFKDVERYFRGNESDVVPGRAKKPTLSRYSTVYIYYLGSKDRGSQFLYDIAKKYFTNVKVLGGKIEKIKFPDIESVLAGAEKELSQKDAQILRNSLKKFFKKDNIVFTSSQDLKSREKELDVIFSYFDVELSFQSDGSDEKLELNKNTTNTKELISTLDSTDFPITVSFDYAEINKKLGGYNVSKLGSKYAVDPEKEFNGKKLSAQLAKTFYNDLLDVIKNENYRLLVLDDNISSGTDYVKLFYTLQNIEKRIKKSMYISDQPLKFRTAGLTLYYLPSEISTKGTKVKS